MSERTSLLIVPHTHWDREWYQTFEQFRYRLVETIDILLDALEADPQFTHFMLDGQTIVLDDYLEVRPENRERLLALCRAGRIQIGPWYLQPDEFLVGGESIIRNLEIGVRMARPYGGAMPVGYVPDTFGHIGQLPQILRGFGLDNAVMWRGVPPEITRGAFNWQAPDGSQVMVLWLYDDFGYSNAAVLPLDPRAFAARVQEIARRMKTRAVISTHLLMNGSDHLQPQVGLPEVMERANALLEKDNMHASIGTLAEYLELLRPTRPELERYQGELRSSYGAHMLPGVLSTRMWLKQRNAAAEAELVRWAEPASTWAWLLGGRYEHMLLDLAWKTLLHNHPHDSICGCGIDEVHADMMPRFGRSQRTANEVAIHALREISRHVDTQGHPHTDPIIVFNPSSAAQRGVVEAEVQPRFMPYEIVDEHGNLVPIQPLTSHGDVLLDQEVDKQLVLAGLSMVQEGRAMGFTLIGGHITENERPGVPRLDIVVAQSGEPDPHMFERTKASVAQLVAREDVTSLHVVAREAQRTRLLMLPPEVPGLGGRTFFLRPSAGNSPDTQDPTIVLHITERLIENAYLRVAVDQQSGEMTLTDKAAGNVYSGLNRVEDTGDIGDLYTFCPPDHDVRVTHPARPPHIEIVERGPVRATIRVERVYQLPVAATPDRKARESVLADYVITSDISLAAGARRVELRTTVENTARDHRLRVLFPVPFAATDSEAEGVFEVTRRPARQPEPTGTIPPWEAWMEAPVNTHPQKRFVDVSDGRQGLALLNRGLPEYEVRPESDGGSAIALTLLRCTGWISHDDLRTRRGPAGPHLATPEAQGLGTHTFEYALAPHVGTWSDNHAFVLREADAYEAGLRAMVTELHPGTIGPTWSFMRVEPAGVQVSAIKRSDDGTGVILRLCNMLREDADVSVECGRSVAEARLANLNEELASDDQQNLARILSTSVHTRLRKGEIQTLKIIFADGGIAGR